MGLDGRLLAMGRQPQRVRLDSGQMATPAPGRCCMGWPELAAWSWRLYLRCGPLALKHACRLDTKPEAVLALDRVWDSQVSPRGPITPEIES